MPYILMFYLWAASTYAGDTVTMVEFSSREKCEAAGQSAANKFGGLASKPYYICVPK